MRWSFAQARRAAAAVRAAEMGRVAARTVRPRGVTGLLHDRAPLALLLYVAARDGLVVARDDGGFAVLAPPLTDAPDRSGGMADRLVRALDRHWGYVAFATPPVLGFAASATTLVLPVPSWAPYLPVLLGMAWVFAQVAGLLVAQLRWVARVGAPAPGHDRVDESLWGHHWSVVLLHQPDPAGVPDLAQALRTRLDRVVAARAQASVRGTARVSVRVTEVLVVRTRGITTRAAHRALAESPHASLDRSNADGDGVLLLDPTAPARAAPQRPIPGGGFLLWYLAAVALVLLVCAQFVADAEAAECSTACTGPTTWGAAVRWLLHRLYFTDGGFVPMTVRVTVLGLLVSLMSVVGAIVAWVAFGQELRINRRTIEEMDDVLSSAVTLVVVVTEPERTAVLAAARERTGRPHVLDQSHPRTVFRLGELGGSTMLLAQLTEAGAATAGGALLGIKELIEDHDPDHVILTGICYGLRPDAGQQLEDIVVASRVQGVDQRKVAPTRVVPRGPYVGTSTMLLDRFQAAQVDWTGARVHFGPMLSSNVLVNSPEFVAELRNAFPDAVAGEMESLGLAEAAREGLKPEWIVVKAISDWGLAKTDDHQAAAAQNAARYVVEVVGSGALLPRRTGRR